MPELKQAAPRADDHGDSVELTGSAIVDEFSLIQGGPIYGLQRRLGLAMPDRRGTLRHAVLTAAFAWLPLLLLAVVQGQALGGVTIPLLRDIATNVRFLISLPLLVAAEVIIDSKLQHAVRHFVTSGLVPRRQMSAFEDVVSKTMRLRGSFWPMVLLVLAAWAPSFGMNGGELITPGPSSWHRLTSGAGLSPAGWWFALVSVPLYRLLLFRWIWLIVVWAVFLARVANLDLGLVPTHPDRAAGLGFLAHTQVFFGWIGFAASASVAARFANMMAYEGQTVSSLKFLIAVAAAVGLGVGSPAATAVV